MNALLLLAVLVCGSTFALEGNVPELMARGDGESKQHHARAALASFHAAETLEPNNPTVALRLSTQYSDLADETTLEAETKLLVEKSLEYAKRAIELDPDNAKAHLNLALCYGKLTDFVGNKAKLECSKSILKETLRSLELNPNDDHAWHVLGRWHFGMANVNGILKAMARLVYGRLPEASNAEALKSMKRASALAPKRIMHHSELARIYTQIGARDLANAEWQKVLTLPNTDKDDEKEKREARSVLGIR